MAIPFSQYHIATSHNTFLGGKQAMTCSRGSALHKALQDGARMIELDIFYDSTLKTIVISHGKYVSPSCNCLFSYPITLEDACDTIADFMTPTTSPLFIMLEVNTGLDSAKQSMVADILRTNLGQYLVSGDIDLRMAFPEHYLGKILLAAGGGMVPSNNGLFSLVNVKFAKEEYLYNRGYNAIISDKVFYGGLLIGGYVMRSYPNNIYLSKNYNPDAMFDLGIQFISMNYQTKDDHMTKYKDRFKDTRMVGYLPMKTKI